MPYPGAVMDLNYAMHGTQPHLPLIAITGWANLETAVDAMRRGARGYIPTPWNNEALLRVLRAEIGQARADHGQWREAQAIHRALLPAVLPDIAGCRLAWRCEPSSGFGGDDYDAFVTGPNASPSASPTSAARGCRRPRLGRSAARRRRHGAGPGLRLRTCGHGQRRPTSEQCPERCQQVK
jgi:hypothetical protein